MTIILFSDMSAYSKLLLLFFPSVRSVLKAECNYFDGRACPDCTVKFSIIYS